MTYCSRKSWISFGFGSSSNLSSEVSDSSSSMISLQRSMHSSQMYTPGPAISFLTCFCDLPQNEHFNRSAPSPNLAIWSSPLAQGYRRRLLERTCLVGPPATVICRLLATGHGQQLLGGLPALDDLVDDAVLLGLVGG